MAKKVSDNKIKDMTVDWGKDTTNGNLPFSGQAVQDFIKRQFGTKVGTWCWSPNVDASNFYHIWGFATEEDKQTYLADPEGNASLLLANEALPISTVQGDSYGAYLFTDVSASKEFVVMDDVLKVNLRFSSVRNSGGDRLNMGEQGTLVIQRKTGNGDWQTVDERPNAIASSDYADTTSFTSVDLSNCLVNGKQQIRVRAYFTYEADDGAKKTATSAFVVIGSSVTKTRLLLTLATQWQTPFTSSDISLSYYVQGSVAKTLNYEVSSASGDTEASGKVALGTAEYVETARDIAVSGLTHGVHHVKAWITVDGTDTRTDDVLSQVMVATDNSDETILVAVNDAVTKATNFIQTTILRFAVHNPKADTTDIKLVVGNYSGTETYATSSMSVANGEVTDYSVALEIDSQDTSINAYIHIKDASGKDLCDIIGFVVDNSQNFAPTSNPDFVLNPKVRSNNEADPAVIINGADDKNVPATFSGFGFKTDGWASDDEGNKCLRVPSGASVAIDYEPYSAFVGSSAKTASLTMEFDIATRNLVDENAPLLRCCSYDTLGNPVGFELKAIEACFMTTNLQTRRDQDVAFQNDTKTHIAVNIVYNLSSSGVNYIRLFVNGVINREKEYSTTDSFVQYVGGVMTSQGIRIGGVGADIDIYGMRIYKRAISATQIRQDYLASLRTTEEKMDFREANDILGDGNLIDYTKAREKYNTILWTGELPSYADKNNKIGDVDIHIVGDPAHSGTMANVEAKGQGTSSRGYWKWNTQFKTSYTDSSGASVKTDWVDENGVHHGAKYMLQEGTPYAEKLVWKLNWASSMQSHKLGSVNLFTDLWRRVVGGNGITNYTDSNGDKPYANCRVSCVQKPFLLFQRLTPDAAPVFYGLVTFGPGKADKPTIGYDKKVFPDYCMLEGSDNGMPLTEHRVPWMTDEVAYNESEEAYQYNGENQWDFDAGNQKMVEKYFVPAYNFAFLHNNNITFFDGNYESLLSASLDQTKAYWVTKDSTESAYRKFDLFRYDFITASWVSASATKTSGVYDRMNLAVQTGITPSGNNWGKINAQFIAWRVADFKAGVGKHFNVTDTMYSMNFHKLIGASDNRCKNTYQYLDPVTHLICFQSDDDDTIFLTDNVGRKNKPYYVEEHDVDASGNAYWNGGDNGFYNLMEAAFPDDLKTVMFTMLREMASLGGGNVAGCMDKYYFAVQRYFPAVAYNETARLLYEEAEVHYKDGTYSPSTPPLPQSLGDQLQGELQWWKRREIYMASYARYGAFGVKDSVGGEAGSDAGALVFRSIATTAGTNPTYKFTVTPMMWLYPSFARGTAEYDGFTRVKAGEAFTSTVIQSDGNTNVYIRGINYYKSVGAFGDKSVGEAFNLSAEKLEAFEAKKGSSAMEFRATSININTPMMNRLDLNGAATLSGELDLGGETKLVTADLMGTGLTNVILPQTSTLSTVKLPAVRSVALSEVPNLSSFSIEDVKNLQSITIGANVGSGANVVSIIKTCIAEGVQLNKISASDLSVSDADEDFITYLLNVTDCSLQGVIRMKDNVNLSASIVQALAKKFGEIWDAANSLYVEFTQTDITSASVFCDNYMGEVGTYQLDYAINPAKGNNLKSIAYSLSEQPYATVDDNGVITVSKVSLTKDAGKATVSAVLSLIGGKTITASKTVYFYKHELAVGDYVFHDGTFSDLSDSRKTKVGVCFYKDENIGLMVAMTDRPPMLKSQWGLNSSYNKDIVLSDGSSPYDTQIPNTPSLFGTGSNYFNDEKYVNSNGEFISYASSLGAGQIGGIKVTEQIYSALQTLLDDIGVKVGDYIGYGQYFTLLGIKHRNTVLSDANVNLGIPQGSTAKEERNSLNDLMQAVMNSHNANYCAYYYPAMSYAYCYAPDVKNLVGKYGYHHWSLSSIGEVMRIHFYLEHSRTGDQYDKLSQALNNGLNVNYAHKAEESYHYTSSEISATQVFRPQITIVPNSQDGTYGFGNIGYDNWNSNNKYGNNSSIFLICTI